MSCDVKSSSPYAESIFEEDWDKYNGGDLGGLEAIAEFNNSSFGAGEVDNGASIDPQLLTNPFSPTNSTGPALNNNTDTIDQMFTPLATLSNNQYPDFTQTSSSATPYFHSIELPTTNAPFHHPPSLRTQLHRRSLSAPPDGLVSDHYLHHQPAVTLHRDGHFLGTPTPQNHSMARLKSLPKYKQNRHQPYGVPTNKRGYQRHQLRRTQTQPVRGGAPTSVPVGMPPMFAPDMLRQMQPPPPQLQYVSSRVCTPDASPAASPLHGQMASPVAIDPILRSSENGRGEGKTVAIPLAVDELRGMITEAVQKAIMGIQESKGKYEDGQQAGMPVETVVDGEELEPRA